MGVPGKGFAIASLVLGIIGAVLCGALIPAILGIVFGGVARSKGYYGSMATAGMTLGVIGCALWIIVMFVWNPYTYLFYL